MTIRLPFFSIITLLCLANVLSHLFQPEIPKFASKHVAFRSKNPTSKSQKHDFQSFLLDGRGGAKAGVQIAKTMTARRMETLK
jgi:hypothetical protein